MKKKLIFKEIIFFWKTTYKDKKIHRKLIQLIQKELGLDTRLDLKLWPLITLLYSRTFVLIPDYISLKFIKQVSFGILCFRFLFGPHRKGLWFYSATKVAS